MFRRLLDWMIGRREPDGGRVESQERRVEELSLRLEKRRQRLEIEVEAHRRNR